MLEFSKGSSWFRPTYLLILDTSNVGGLRANAMVLMSGVRVGTVSGAVLSPAGHKRRHSSEDLHRIRHPRRRAVQDRILRFFGRPIRRHLPRRGLDGFCHFAYQGPRGVQVKKLREKSDPVSKFLADNMDGDTANLVAKYPSATVTELNPELVMAQFLNRIIAGPPIYDGERFQNVMLRPETLELAGSASARPGLSALESTATGGRLPRRIGAAGRGAETRRRRAGRRSRSTSKKSPAARPASSNDWTTPPKRWMIPSMKSGERS